MAAPEQRDESNVSSDEQDGSLEASSDRKGLIIGVAAGLLIVIGIMAFVGHRHVEKVIPFISVLKNN